MVVKSLKWLILLAWYCDLVFACIVVLLPVSWPLTCYLHGSWLSYELDNHYHVIHLEVLCFCITSHDTPVIWTWWNSMWS